MWSRRSLKNSLERFWGESCIIKIPEFVGGGAFDAPQVICVINGTSWAPSPTISDAQVDEPLTKHSD